MRYRLVFIKPEGNRLNDSKCWVEVYKECFLLARINPYLGEEELLIRFVWEKRLSASPTCVSEEDSERMILSESYRVSTSGLTDVSKSSDVIESTFDKQPIIKLIAMPINRSLALYFIMLSHIFIAKITFISYIRNVNSANNCLSLSPQSKK